MWKLKVKEHRRGQIAGAARVRIEQKRSRYEITDRSQKIKESTTRGHSLKVEARDNEGHTKTSVNSARTSCVVNTRSYYGIPARCESIGGEQETPAMR